jgi:hypothetical protein
VAPVRELIFSYQFRISAGFNDALARPMLLLMIYSLLTNRFLSLFWRFDGSGAASENSHR